MKRKGVDISQHNGAVDFSALRAAGVEFVLVRLGFGSDYESQDDSRFGENVEKAEAAGLPWGAYLYSYAQDEAMAQSEARHALRVLGGRTPSYGVWLDVEDIQIAHADVAATSAAFCRAMEAAGLYAGVYASLSWWEGPLADPRLDPFDKWVAQWNSACTYKGQYGIWQFTDSLVIGGKPFDGNWAYKDYPAITRAMRGPETEECGLTEAEVKGIARREVAAYLAEQAKKPVADWAQGAVALCLERGLMRGDAEGGFRPQSFITRQEVAAVLANLLAAGD